MKFAFTLGFVACAAIAHGSGPEWVISVRETPDAMVWTGSGQCQASELCLINPKTNRSELLVRGREDPDITKTIASIASPAFSTDRRFVYFVSEAWATSGSIQRVEIATKKVSFLIDGCALEVIKSGIFEGFLLVDRYLIEDNGRDSYVWLVSPDGKPRMQIGQSDGEAVGAFRKLYMADQTKGLGQVVSND